MTSIFPNDIFDLASEVAKTAALAPNRVAVIEPGGKTGKRTYREYTYQQLSADAEAIALGLREIGIEEGTRTVFMAPPSYESAALGVALTRVGATLIWIDPSVGYLNVAERLGRLAPEAFVGIPISLAGRTLFGWGPRFLARSIVVNGRFPGAHTLASLKRPVTGPPEPPARSPDDPCHILYTTGSTGPAKPALYLHRNFCAVYRTAHYGWRFGNDARPPVDLAAFPAFLFIGLSAGGTVVVPPINFVRQGPADVDPQAIIEVVNDTKVRTFFASPALLERVAAYAKANAVKMPSVERVIGGGAPVFAPLIEALRPSIHPKGEIWANYGATEALPSTEMGDREFMGETNPHTARGAGICVGRPFPGIELKIVEISDGIIARLSDAEACAEGEIGEILVSGPNISPCYDNDEHSTKKNKVYGDDGRVWHRLGDAGYLDALGRLWVCGRTGQRLCWRGGTLFPIQVEAIFDAHPAVRRSGLVGVEIEGELRPVIVIETLQPLSERTKAALAQELFMRAEPFEHAGQVRHLLFKDQLFVDPRHNAKIERPALARWARNQTPIEART